MKWRTRLGRLVHPADMTDSHLAHSIAKIKRDQWRLAWLPVLEAEVERRKTAAPTPDEIMARAIGEAEEALWREENVT